MIESKKETTLDWAIIIAFSIYFGILLSIGVFAHGKSKSETDFILGARSLNYWLTALSAHAADMSAWLFMALPAAIYFGGMPQLWIVFGLLGGMYLNWKLVAPRLRVGTEKYDSVTLSTFFERRFNDTSGVLRLLTSVLSAIFLTIYISAGLIAMGYLFELLFSVDYYIGVVISMVGVLVYTYFGGFIAIAWTDLFQAIFLLFMVLLVPFVALTHLDGIQVIHEVSQVKNIPMRLLENYDMDSLFTAIMVALGWGLGYFGQPHIITKFMGIRDPKEINKALYVGMTWQFFAFVGAISVGLVGIAYFPAGLDNSELIYAEMVRSLFHPFIGGFILCAILGANLSTMDSQILVCASTLSEDLYKKLIRPKASSKELLKVSRLAVLAIGLFSLLISLTKSSTVASTVFYAWSGLGCSFGPLILASLFSKKVNRYGAIAGIIAGGLMGGAWIHINHWIIDYSIPTLIPGFIVTFAVIFGISKLTEERAKRVA